MHIVEKLFLAVVAIIVLSLLVGASLTLYFESKQTVCPAPAAKAQAQSWRA